MGFDYETEFPKNGGRYLACLKNRAIFFAGYKERETFLI